MGVYYARTQAQIDNAWQSLNSVIANVKALDVLEQEDNMNNQKYGRDLFVLTQAMKVHYWAEAYMEPEDLNELLDHVSGFNYYL